MTEPIKIMVTQPLIQRMMNNASFEVDPIQIPISSESAITTISLSIVDGEELPISGLPRALLAKKAVKGNCALSSHHQVPTKMLILALRQHYLHPPTNIGHK